MHKYPLAEGTKLRQFFADEGHLYFLFDGRFSIYNKQYLDAHRTRFNMQWYAQEKERYALAMDSLGLRQTQSFPLYLEKSRWLEEQFGAFLAIHPMPDHLGLAYNIWEYEPFRAGFFEALAARRVRPDILEKNYSPLLRRLANDGKIKAVLFLDSRHRVIAFEELFKGSINSAEVHPRELIKRVLHFNAAAVILAHNHPSGIAEPSQADREITQRLRAALALVDVRLLDHMVVGDTEVISLAELGCL